MSKAAEQSPTIDPHAHQLTDAVHTLAREGGLIAQLAELLPEPTQYADTGTTGRHKITGSPAPWNSEAATVYMDIHAGAREIEDNLRAILGFARLYAGKARPEHRRTGPRGSTTRNTITALRAIPDLARAAGPEHVRRAADQIATWVRAAQQVRDIDTAERWVPVPRLPGHRPAACPYCKTYALRMQPRAGRVICTNHACRNPDGQRPQATVIVGAVSGTAALEFQDGARVTFTPPEETHP